MTVTTLTATGAVQTYTVPVGVTFVTLEAWGGAGAGTTSGKGGYAKGSLIVASGTVLNVYVGGQGTLSAGGWNGGGSSGSYGGGTGSGGGGASDVRLAGTALANRVIVGGGGGGYGNADDGVRPGGAGGGANGAGSSGGLAIGGTQTSGYTFGIGASQPSIGFPGGGGGGGYWGGGVASGGAGAAGGSGYTGTLTNPTMTTGVRAGNGQVVITAVNTAPNAPTLLGPPVNGYILAGVTNAFTWQASDPDPGDYQTRADFRYKKTGDSLWTTINNAATTVSSYTLAASTWTTGFQYEWQVATYDNAAVIGPWSASSFTNVITALSAPTIVTPTAGATEFTTPISMSWTLPSGFTSDAYQVQRNSLADGTGTSYYDSGVVVTTGLTASIPLDAAAGRTDYLRVAFRYYGHWSPFASSSIVDQFGPPQVPAVALVATSNLAQVMATITNPPAGGGYADALVNDLYRNGVRIAANLGPNAVYVDKLPGAGVNTYLVTAFAANGASSTST